MNPRNPTQTCWAPTLVSWIGDTELRIMALFGNEQEQEIARRILRLDKDIAPHDLNEELGHMDWGRAYSSLHLILGEAGPNLPRCRPAGIPDFQRLLLLFSRNGICRKDFVRFVSRYRSFLLRKCMPGPHDLKIDIYRLEIDPWNYGEVYEATRQTLDAGLGKQFDRSGLYLNLTPGTVTQEITLALIGKERSPTRFIQVSKSRRTVTVCDIPWDLNLIRKTDSETIAKDFPPGIAALFPETPEGNFSKQRLATIARTDVDCLLTGETGVGKNWVAETVFKRKDLPFVSFNCAALGGDLNMLRVQLFGAKKGAYTGASEDIPGIAASADGGILFLDEVECLKSDAQQVLLDFIQPREGARSPMERTFTPVGGHEKTVSLRIVAATNQDLWKMVKAGEFREDLYWRLAFVSFHIPSIAERMAQGHSPDVDSAVARMARQFLEEFAKRWQRKATFAPDALQCLENREWPGNVRQLRNLVGRALLFAPQDGLIDLATVQRELRQGETGQTDTPPAAASSPPQAQPLPPFSSPNDLRAVLDRDLKTARSRAAQTALAQSGTQLAAATLLGISRQTLAKWLKL